MRTLVIIVLMLLFAVPATATNRSAMSRAEKQALDTFCSNFSETDLAGFREGQLTEADMLSFALAHARINDDKALRVAKDHSAVFVPAALVDKVTEKYFGRKIARQALSEYRLLQASGEAYTFSQITSLSPLGNDRFEAKGLIYTASSGSTLDPHADPAAWKKAGEDVQHSGNFTATIQSVGNRYVLLAYQVTDARPIRGCEGKKIRSLTAQGVYQGLDQRSDDYCLASVKTDAGEVVTMRCVDIEQYFGKDKGKRVFLLATQQQFWNEPAAACERALFFESGTALSPAN